VPVVANLASAATALPSPQAEELLELLAIYRTLPASGRSALVLAGRTLAREGPPVPVHALLTSFLQASPEMQAAVVGWLQATAPTREASPADAPAPLATSRRSTPAPRLSAVPRR
jgi:hypothetical protein